MLGTDAVMDAIDPGLQIGEDQNARSSGYGSQPDRQGIKNVRPGYPSWPLGLPTE